jgi:sugar phosphate isomerase/epimerase
MAGIPIGLQLWSVKDACKEDLAGTLKALAKMGYDGVESGAFIPAEAAQMKALLDETGLKMCGTHVPMDTLRGENLAKTVEFYQTCGCSHLIVPYMRHSTREDCERFAEELSGVAEKLRPYGMSTGYHLHYHDLAPRGGEWPWDTIFSTGSKDLIAQMDAGNCLGAGADPVKLVRRYPGQAVTVHVKDWCGPAAEPLVGEGNVPWAEFFEACESVGGATWYIVEQEKYPVPPLQAVEQCLKNLRAMGK